MSENQDKSTSANFTDQRTAWGQTNWFQSMPQFMTWFSHIARGNTAKPEDLEKFISWATPFEFEKLFASLSTGHSPLTPLTSMQKIPGLAELSLFSDSFRAVFAGAFEVNGCGDGPKLSDAITQYEVNLAAMRQKQAELAQFYEDSWKIAQSRFLLQLEEKQRAGETFSGMADSLRTWTETLSQVAHELLPQPDTVKLLTETMHCLSRLRLAQSHLVELVSEMLNVPTRAEVDEAYRLIQELRREVRALKASV